MEGPRGKQENGASNVDRPAESRAGERDRMTTMAREKNERRSARAPDRSATGREAGTDPLHSAERYSQLAFGFVIASLLLLAVLPVWVHSRTERINRLVAGVLEPARAALTDIETALALEVAGTRGFLLTGETRYAAEVSNARALRDSAVVRFFPLAQRMGPPVSDQASGFTDTLHLADSLIDALAGGRLARADYQVHLGEQHARFRAAVEAANRLHKTIDSVSAEQRAAMRSLERSGARLSGLLVLFAIAAAVTVARLGHRYRTLAIGFNVRARELERVTRSRARLIRGFTHDVKNPLGAADGSLALLEEGVVGELTPTQLERVRRGRRSIHAALDLIGHLMDLARAETGHMTIHRAPTDLCALAAEVAEEFRAQVEAAGLTLTVELPHELPLIDTDPPRARQILANLVSNAVKYTPNGGRVTVRAEVHATAPVRAPRAHRRPRPAGAPSASFTGPWLAVAVIDTGPGIKPEDQALLFQEFTRFDPDAAHGSGIGLAISQRVARALGGRIHVWSEPGAGSTFTLWLPARGRESESVGQ
ncbi:MAG TPA: ATP-binding protein [Gemmatimonadaceae bacterium]